MKKYRAIIFDMDGTIIDTEFVWNNVNKNFLKKKNLYDEQLFKKFYTNIHGLALHEVALQMKKHLGIAESPEEIKKELRTIAHEAFTTGEIPYIRGFRTFHSLVKKNNIPTAIATNADEHGLKNMTERMKLQKYFGTHLYGIKEVGYRAKPSPDIYIHAAKQLGIPPEECIAIEDSPCGISAAKNANMHCIAIDTAGVASLLSHADKIVSGYREIILEEYFEKKENDKKIKILS